MAMTNTDPKSTAVHLSSDFHDVSLPFFNKDLCHLVFWTLISIFELNMFMAPLISFYIIFHPSLEAFHESLNFLHRTQTACDCCRNFVIPLVGAELSTTQSLVRLWALAA